MFLLSVLFMTGWVVAVVTGFAGQFAHLLGLASIATIVLRSDRRHRPLAARSARRSSRTRRANTAAPAAAPWPTPGMVANEQFGTRPLAALR